MMVHSRITKTVSAALSGILLTMAFPKAGWAVVAWIALVPLITVVRDAPAAQAFRLGFIAGLAHYMTLLYWIVPTMQIYGHLPLYVSAPVLFLFSGYLALYVGLFSLLAALLCRGNEFRPLWIPPAWVAAEYLRASLLTGFPWELLGYSQHGTTALIQVADLAGVYGVSFLVVLGNTAASQAYRLLVRVRLGKARTAALPAAATALIFTGLLTGTWLYGRERIGQVETLTATAPVRRIAAVQGNIDQSVKWNPDFQLSTVSKYVRLSRFSASERPELVVWPETATPFYFFHDPGLTEFVLQGIRNTAGHFLIGSNAVERTKDRYAYYNSAYLIGPDGRDAGRYDKVHLVPFGEYVPLKKWLPFIGKMVEHVGDFEPGRHGNTLQWVNETLGILICYEIIFPELSRQQVKNGASLLINITNDAWYGRTSAPYQHFSMAVFRAVENRRSLVRAANTGISGFIDPAGRVMASTPLFREAAITRAVPIIDEHTVYTRFGDLFAVICLLTTAIMVIIKAWMSRNLTLRE